MARASERLALSVSADLRLPDTEVLSVETALTLATFPLSPRRKPGPIFTDVAAVQRLPAAVSEHNRHFPSVWIPAFAGMTMKGSWDLS